MTVVTDFAFDVVHFGDCPAANCLEIGRNMTAEAGRGIDSVAADNMNHPKYCHQLQSRWNSKSFHDLFSKVECFESFYTKIAKSYRKLQQCKFVGTKYHKGF